MNVETLTSRRRPALPVALITDISRTTCHVAVQAIQAAVKDYTDGDNLHAYDVDRSSQSREPEAPIA